MHGHQSGSCAERVRLPQKRRSKDGCDGKAWTPTELRALEDGVVALGAGRAAEVCEQVLASALAWSDLLGEAWTAVSSCREAYGTACIDSSRDY